uniref:DDE Tnp4 domain-containing protein n=1 Tax=Brassica oleracea var. oleracea TaxID=109376 RepID=A0A0D3CY82_BRAOL
MFAPFYRRNNPLVWRSIPKTSNTGGSGKTTIYWRTTWISRNGWKHRLYALGVEELPSRLEKNVFTRNRKTHNCVGGGSFVRPLIWHTFFGVPGTMNNLNILDRSPVFDEIINGNAPEVNFHVNGREYHLAYYLADGPKHCLFAKHQEAVRKDVERAFGVLQARFAVVRNSSNLWYKNKIGNIMRACIILHNMIIEDERDSYINASEFQQRVDVDPTFVVKRTTNLGTTMGRRAEVRNTQGHQ